MKTPPLNIWTQNNLNGFGITEPPFNPLSGLTVKFHPDLVFPEHHFQTYFEIHIFTLTGGNSKRPASPGMKIEIKGINAMDIHTLGISLEPDPSSAAREEHQPVFRVVGIHICGQ